MKFDTVSLVSVLTGAAVVSADRHAKAAKRAEAANHRPAGEVDDKRKLFHYVSNPTPVPPTPAPPTQSSAAPTVGVKGCCSWYGGKCGKPLTNWCHGDYSRCTQSCQGTWVYPGLNIKKKTTEAPTEAPKKVAATETPTEAPVTPTEGPKKVTKKQKKKSKPTAAPTTSPTTSPTARPTELPKSKPTGSLTAEPYIAQSNPCQCKDSWTSSDGGRCGQTQYGCPMNDCLDEIGVESSPWCLITDPSCDTAELGNGYWWSYCQPEKTNISCTCKSKWSTIDEGCTDEQFGCPSQACDGYATAWCVVEDPRCEEAEEYNGSYWFYC